MTGPRLAADVMMAEADKEVGPLTGDGAIKVYLTLEGYIDALLAGADMVALVRTDNGVEVLPMQRQSLKLNDWLVRDCGVVDLKDHPAPADTPSYESQRFIHEPYPGDGPA